MFRKYFLVSLVLFLLQSCYQPERECGKYRTGTFKFDYEIGDTMKTGRFVRGDSYSVDYYEDRIDSATVRWFNDCDIDSKVAIQYKIISTTDSSYTFQYKSAVKDPNKKLIVKTGTAYKID